MLKVGMAQMSVLEGNVNENRIHLESLIKSHAADEIDLLCFPELCISGYDYRAAAESTDEIEFFAEMASKYNIALLAGVHAAVGGKHYDACCMWNECGDLLGEYRKIHLWDTEYDFFDKGEELVVVPFKGWNIGMLICADYGFSELSTQLAIKMGADMIIYPSAWYPGWEDLFVTSCKMRAAESQIYTIGMNRASGNRQYCGNTTVANPDGSILMRLETTGEAYGRVTLFKEKIDAARDALPWRKMKREDIYSKF